MKSMDTMSAFAMGMANRGKESMVFDWDKAARIIKERGAKTASAGLSGDWEYTGGVIFRDGKPCMDEYTYLASTWATPELEVCGETIDCYVMGSTTEWNCDTKWPSSAPGDCRGCMNHNNEPTHLAPPPACFVWGAFSGQYTHQVTWKGVDLTVDVDVDSDGVLPVRVLVRGVDITNLIDLDDGGLCDACADAHAEYLRA